MIRTLLWRSSRTRPASFSVASSNQGNILSRFPLTPLSVPLRHFCADEKPQILPSHCASTKELANGDPLIPGLDSKCRKDQEAIPTNVSPNGCQEEPLPVLRDASGSLSTSNEDESCESLSSHEADYDTDLTSSVEDEMDSSSGESSSNIEETDAESPDHADGETDSTKSCDEEKIDMDSVPDDLKEMLQEGYVLETIEEGGLPAEGFVELLTIDEVKQVLEEVRARDVRIFSVNDRCEWTDTMVVTTGISDRHVRGIADALVYKIKKKGQVESPLYPTVEGQVGGSWLVVDCGNIVIHILNEESRAYYKLEDLWTGNARPSTADEDLETMLKKSGLKELTSKKKP